jgi:hypothetical protein
LCATPYQTIVGATCPTEAAATTAVDEVLAAGEA